MYHQTLNRNVTFKSCKCSSQRVCYIGKLICTFFPWVVIGQLLQYIYLFWSVRGDFVAFSFTRAKIAVGESLLTSLFTFFLINTRPCVEKCKIQIDFTHILKISWNLSNWWHFCLFGGYIREGISFKSCKLFSGKSANEFIHSH